MLLPPLTDRWLAAPQEPDEILPNNDGGIARDSAEWLLREMNAENYLDLVEELASGSTVPVFAGLSFSNRKHWVRYARRVTQAGATGVELRVMDHGQHLRSDQIEKRAIRIVAQVVDSLDEPVIVRIKSSVTGLAAFTQALCDAGAKAIIIESPRITEFSDSGLSHTYSSPLVPIEAVRRVYRRISAHLAVDLGTADSDTVRAAILAGATAVVYSPVENSEQLRNDLLRWMKSRKHTSIFDFRGSLSESKLATSIISG